MAVANSLTAVMEGARQIECTINGIGERAGNCALEEIVMALQTRRDFYGLYTHVNTRLLYPTSRKVAHVTGIQVQRNKAVVGQNAFAHESGIHQDGMLKHANTYEIMRPEEVGIPKTELVLGKHSGRHALKQKVHELGYHLTEDQLQRLFDQFKVLADRKKTVYDADIEALAEDILHSGPTLWSLHAVSCSAGSGTIPAAVVVLWNNRDGQIMKEAATGDGPVNAIFTAIERVTGYDVTVKDYRVRSVSVGEDAQGEAQVEAEFQKKTYTGRGVSTDVIEASALAFVQLINRIALRQEAERKIHPTDAPATGTDRVLT
jgi:2-isopropylmalate synthase